MMLCDEEKKIPRMLYCTVLAIVASKSKVRGRADRSRRTAFDVAVPDAGGILPAESVSQSVSQSELHSEIEPRRRWFLKSI